MKLKFKFAKAFIKYIKSIFEVLDEVEFIVNSLYESIHSQKIFQPGLLPKNNAKDGIDTAHGVSTPHLVANKYTETLNI